MQEPAQPAQEAERTSRQDLVIAPRHSSLPMLLGAVLCAGTGFGMVWALGIGRSTGVGETAPPAQTAMPMPPSGEPSVAFMPEEATPPPVHDALSMSQSDLQSGEPRPFPTATSEADAPRAMNERTERGWRPPAAPAANPPVIDRYQTRPATLESPDSSSAMPPAQDGRSSRFAPPGRFPGSGDEPVRLASAESAAIESQPTADQTDSPSPADAGQVTDALPPAEKPADAGDAPLPGTLAAEPKRSSADLLAPAPSDMTDPADAVSPLPAPSPPPLSSAAAGTTAEPATAPPGFTSPDIAPPASFRSAAAAPASPIAAASSPAAVISAAATNPFASAPPMGPPQTRQAPVPGDDRGLFAGTAATGPGTATAGSGAAAGQGRPGPMQLEGLQTPQLAVEKRGPREIQVGKPARYEILVRNVGNATAQDVTLRDAVPYGTTLITTTPPASPVGSGPNALQAAATAAELVWPLGVLPPGGEARVSMEVMPQIEGEIGSVASVSFRTEASVRSRATKPDLKLDASETKAVRIGGEVKLSLKVSNPGTGVATGVVLDGMLPDGVSHSAGRELEFDVGQLRPGESRTIDLLLGTTGPGVHMARFAARADGRLEVEQPVRIEVTAPTLELSAEMPSRRYLQRPATCVLSMVNAGTATARAVELVAQLPPGMKFVRANHAGWYEERSHRVLWNLEELPPGETGTVEMVLMPVDLGPQKIVSAARSSDGPSDQAAHTVEVEGLAALFFEVTDSEDPIEVGGMTEYIVRIGNQGTKAASGVRLTATLLGDLEPVDAKGPAAHRVENLAVIFEPLARLAPTEEAVFRVRVRGRREGDQRMQVQLVSDDHPAPITKEEITRVYADR